MVYVLNGVRKAGVGYKANIISWPQAVIEACIIIEIRYANRLRVAIAPLVFRLALGQCCTTR